MPRAAELIKMFLMISIALFFLQALRTVFSSLFGIIYDQIFEGPTTLWLGTSSLILLAALLAPSFVPERVEKGLVPLAIVFCVIARWIMTLSGADVRYWSAVVVILTGAFLLRAALERMPRESILAVLGALIAGQLLRNLGTTYDLSLRPSWLAVQALWSALLLGALYLGRPELPSEANSPGWLVGLAFGAFLFLELSLLSLPNGLSRWSHWSYAILVPALLAATIAPLVPAIWEGAQISIGTNLAPRVLAGIILVAGLAVGYFRSGPLAGIALLSVQIALLLSTAVLFGVERPEGRTALWLPLGFLLFLLLNYFNAFAFTYPYTLPAMRGLGWVVYLAAAAVVSLALLIQPRAVELVRPPSPALIIFGGVALLASVIAIVPRRVLQDEGKNSLSIATYNIHYGFDEDWNYTLDQQVETIRQSGADAIALQEVDVGRLTSYSVDLALYMARRLGMNVAYLPTIEHLTGIAILYRGQEIEITSQLLSSDLEQTGIVGVTLPLGDREFGAYGVWIGLEPTEAERQVSEALEFIGDQSPVALAGDFNLEHGDAPIEQIKLHGFIDPFQALGFDPPPPTEPASDPSKQIDFVWLRGMAPMEAFTSESLASDHRMVVTRAGGLP